MKQDNGCLREKKLMYVFMYVNMKKKIEIPIDFLDIPHINPLSYVTKNPFFTSIQI